MTPLSVSPKLEEQIEYSIHIIIKPKSTEELITRLALSICLTTPLPSLVSKYSAFPATRSDAKSI